MIPAEWLQEPNYETGKNRWWRLRRADGLPWMIAGIYSEWTDPGTDEIVPINAFIPFNVNSHRLLSRLHKPERDPTTNEINHYLRSLRAQREKPSRFSYPVDDTVSEWLDAIDEMFDTMAKREEFSRRTISSV